jgi:hypothetical protein
VELALWVLNRQPSKEIRTVNLGRELRKGTSGRELRKGNFGTVNLGRELRGRELRNRQPWKGPSENRQPWKGTSGPSENRQPWKGTSEGNFEKGTSRRELRTVNLGRELLELREPSTLEGNFGGRELREGNFGNRQPWKGTSNEGNFGVFA